MNTAAPRPDVTPDMQERFARAEAEFRGRLAGWWERIGIEPHYPCDTATVLKLLAAVEYKADVETVHRYIADGYIVPAKDETGAHAWLAANIVEFATALEKRRMWLPFSALHDHKKSPFERGHEIAQARGLAEGVCRDIDKHTVEDLLLYLKDADTQPARDALYLALKLKLEALDRLA
jgi:hypothetical protein